MSRPASSWSLITTAVASACASAWGACLNATRVSRPSSWYVYQSGLGYEPTIVVGRIVSTTLRISRPPESEMIVGDFVNNARLIGEDGADVPGHEGPPAAHDRHRVASEAELVRRAAGGAHVPGGDGRPALPRAVRRHADDVSAGPGAGRPGHLHRRRLPVRRRRRRPELDQLPAVPHERLRPRPSQAHRRRPRRPRLPARAHPARLPGGP